MAARVYLLHYDAGRHRGRTLRLRHSAVSSTAKGHLAVASGRLEDRTSALARTLSGEELIKHTARRLSRRKAVVSEEEGKK